MAVNKVDLNGETVLDLTGDTVTPEALNKGVTAHNAAGERITGTQVPVRTVNNIDPDTNGNVALTGGDIPYTAAGSTTVKSEIDDRQMDTKKLDAETEIADGDAFPFYDASEGINRKTLWSNIVAKLKNLFLPLTGGTVTGQIINTTSSGNNFKATGSSNTADIGFRATNTNTKAEAFLEVYGAKAGIYLPHKTQWMIVHDGTNVNINGHKYQQIYSGTGTPASSTGANGDIYVKY